MQFEKDTVQITPETGAVVLDGRYQVLSEIGKGGMGAVFMATQLSTGKRVAVKFIHAHKLSDKLLVRFKQEAGFMGSLSHPNLVTLLDYGVDENGSPFLVMDYIEGESLSARLKREPKLTESELTAIFMQIAKSLSYLHGKKIIHRDLKPSNIVVLQNVDGEPLVKLLDLGVAKSLHEPDPDAAHLTETGDVVGSPAYMSPEQALGQQLDVRSDIFSLGCMMYQSLTGELPFKGETPVQYISQRLVNDAPPIKGATIAPHLVPIAMKCLARDREKRYANANELIDVLRPAPATAKTKAVPDDSKPVVIPPKSDKSIIGIILIALVICGGLWAYETATVQDRRRAARDRLFAEHQFAAEPLAREIVEADKRDRNVGELQILTDTFALGRIEHDTGNLEASAQAYRDLLSRPSISSYPKFEADAKAALAEIDSTSGKK